MWQKWADTLQRELLEKAKETCPLQEIGGGVVACKNIFFRILVFDHQNSSIYKSLKLNKAGLTPPKKTPYNKIKQKQNRNLLDHAT